MPRKKIILQTDAPHLRSGLAENGRNLMNWLARRDKYDLVYYCSQVAQNDPNLSRLPYKAYGAIPADPTWQMQLGGDFGRIRDVAYGGRFIQDILKAEQPTIWIGSNDAWSFQMANYGNAPWFKQINSVLHITVDSIPVTPLAYEQAAATPYFLSWAKFAVDEMKRVNPKTCGHVDYIYGASDTSKFHPVTLQERTELRRTAGLDPKDLIFIQLSRNQLRKEFGNVLQAFAEFRKVQPQARTKLLLHTDWKDPSQGWDLPRLRDYFGIKKEDVLATYLCRHCGRWEVKAYNGEDQDCRHCGTKKAQITPNLFHEGIPDDELYQVYGLADASLSVCTSGGYEYTSANSLLCGLPLAVTNYSCGEDFCQQPFIYPIKWHARHEVQSSFIKAANDIGSIRDFMSKVYAMSVDERRAWGAEGRAWSEKVLGVDAIGAKWESLFDSMSPKDWSSITLEFQKKNETAPMPAITEPEKWVRALYNTILLCEPDPDGLKNWMASLERGASREAIYNYFINEARKDNAKNAPQQDFGVLFDQDTKDPARRKRILFVIRESAGDVFICTALFPGLKRLYPGADLYVACESKYAGILAGNEHIHKVIPYHPAMDNELAMRHYVDHFYWPAIATQVRLHYLTHDKVGLDLAAKPGQPVAEVAT